MASKPKGAHKKISRERKRKFVPVHAIKAYGEVEVQLHLFIT
jgi:hypothetical protein